MLIFRSFFMFFPITDGVIVAVDLEADLTFTFSERGLRLNFDLIITVLGLETGEISLSGDRVLAASV